MNRAIALAVVLFAATVAQARAEMVGPAVPAQTPSGQISHTVKQARVETGGAQIFIVNGKRVSVPTNDSAEAIIKALKERYPGLKPDTGAQGLAAAVN
mgnify:CR=1 FL=1